MDDCRPVDSSSLLQLPCRPVRLLHHLPFPHYLQRKVVGRKCSQLDEENDGALRCTGEEIGHQKVTAKVNHWVRLLDKVGSAQQHDFISQQ